MAASPPHFATAAAELAPVDPQDRILLLDVLRGFAMFGVLWSNLNDWYGRADPSSNLDYALAWTQDWLIESHFYSLLGFLFGAGFAIQLTRAEQRGIDVHAMFCRRMAVLLGIGVVHGMLIWRGDVLTEYALLGFILVLYRRLSARQLLAAAAATYIGVPYLVGVALAALGVKFGPPPAPEPANWIYAHGAFPQIAVQGMRDYLFHYRRFSLFIFPPFLTLFVLGLWAVRVDLVKRLMTRRRSLLWVLGATAAGALLGTYWLMHLPERASLVQSPPNLVNALSSERFLHSLAIRLADALATWGSAAAYATVLALLVTVPACARRLEPLAAAGRMSLTTYLTQSFVSVALFYHYGFGWYDHVGYQGMFAVTAILFSLQMAASVWWLRRFRFGPVEWLWRSLAYGKRQPMRRKPALKFVAPQPTR